MINSKNITIGDKEITIKELTTAQVIELIESAGQEGIEILVGVQAGIPSDMKRLMKKTIDLPPEIFDELTDGINGFIKLEKAFREVNADFFEHLPDQMTATLKSAKAMQSQMLSLRRSVS